MTPPRHPTRPQRRPDPFSGSSGSCWNSASSNIRASSVFSPASSSSGTGTPQRAIPCSTCGNHGLNHLHPPIALVLRRDHVPRRQRSVGQAQHVRDGGVVLRPLLPVAPVLRRELPRLEGIVAAALETAQLLLVRHVHPELDDDHSFFGQAVLEVVDLLIRPAPLDLGGQVLDPFDEDPAVPTAVEDGHAAPSGQRRPEAPQEVVAQLVGRRCGERRDVHVPGVERLDQPLDGATLAGGVPALEDDADRRAELAVVELTAVDQPQVQQAALRLLQPLALLVFGEPEGEVTVLEAWIGGVGVVLAAVGGEVDRRGDRRRVVLVGTVRTLRTVRPVALVGAVVMVAAVASVIVLAHVVCCSRSAAGTPTSVSGAPPGSG